MSCNHCKTRIENNLSKIIDVKKVQVDLNTGKTFLQGDKINLKDIENKINELRCRYKP